MHKKILLPCGSPLSFIKSIMAYDGIAPGRLVVAMVYGLKFLVNYPLVLFESLYLYRRIQKQTIGETPIFIIGHYRSGTTLMYKLMTADPRWRYINEYELMFPHHSVVVEGVIKPVLQHFLRLFKTRHPNFNNYVVNLDDPNDDEGYLVSAGAPWCSYWAFIFPRAYSKIVQKSILFTKDQDKESWKDSYLYFLKKLNWKKRGHLLIKSPPNTARIPAILEIFPDARFIYMHRNPHDVYCSMQKIWQEEIIRYFCLQKIETSEINCLISAQQNMLLQAFERDRELIPQENLIEVVYEKLIVDPFSTVKKIYEKFNLPLSEKLCEQFCARIEAQKGYQDSRYPGI